MNHVLWKAQMIQRLRVTKNVSPDSGHSSTPAPEQEGSTLLREITEMLWTRPCCEWVIFGGHPVPSSPLHVGWAGVASLVHSSSDQEELCPTAPEYVNLVDKTLDLKAG